MRRLLLTLSTALALVVLVQPADAQIRFGAQGAVMTGLEDLSAIDPNAPSLNGTFGLGARAAFQPPLLPIGVIGQGVYYFPDGDGSYMTYSLAAQLRVPTPIISPYALGGWQFRRSEDAVGGTETESGPMLGVGIQFNFAVSLFLEGTFEFNDEITGSPDFDNNPIVIKGGIMFG